jgi:hypothetical protein
LLDALFLFSAVTGGAAVALRLLFMLFGVGDDHSFGAAHDVGADGARSAATLLMIEKLEEIVAKQDEAARR